MSVSAALFLAAAASAPASGPEASRGAALAEARVTATILPAVAVRRRDGAVRADDAAPRHQVSRRGNRVLVEFQ
jgi:hypothetical protein